MCSARRYVLILYFVCMQNYYSTPCLLAGLRAMTRAGAIPSLVGLLSDCTPPALQNLTSCPEGFGCSPTSKPQVPLQDMTNRPSPVRRSVTHTLFPPDTEALSEQDVAVLCLLFFRCWEAAKRCEATQQPLALKSASIVRLVKKQWKPCGVRLQEGKYTKRVSNRHDFDGQALLQLVAKYRSNPKGRAQMHDELRTRLREYYQVMCIICL